MGFLVKKKGIRLSVEGDVDELITDNNVIRDIGRQAAVARITKRGNNVS